MGSWGGRSWGWRGFKHVWNYHFDPDTNVVGVYIQRLRSKIDADAPVKLIETVRGVGYRVKDLKAT